jgi:hypothetical protein
LTLVNWSTVAARTLVLHVGIHKTASTYIQHRLKRNQAFLAQHRLLYPKRRRDHLHLVKAFKRGNLKPWLKLLRRAERQGQTPLISAELLSLLLHQRGREGSRSLLAQLSDALEQAGVRLHLVAFVRDQPAYLNSRYTQLIKRLYFSSSFRRYVIHTMRSGGESECDYEVLFGEALDNPRISTTFLPFRSGEADPCERLLAAVGVPSCAGLAPIDPIANAQPGWQAVWIAQRLARLLRRRHPQAWRSPACKAAIRERLEQEALRQHWPAEPFQGLSAPLMARIQGRYAASNQRFAQRVWACSWGELFPRPQPQPSPGEPRTPAEHRQLVELADQLLAVGLKAMG